MIGILKYAADQTLALGVSDQQKDATAILLRADSSLDKILWNLDSRTGLISLSASDGALALAIKNKNIASGTDLVLQLTNQNESTQKWDFASKPGFIFSQANKSYVIDDQSRGGAGTRVQLFEFNGSIAQQWKFVPLDRVSLSASE